MKIWFYLTFVHSLNASLLTAYNITDTRLDDSIDGSRDDSIQSSILGPIIGPIILTLGGIGISYLII